MPPKAATAPDAAASLADCNHIDEIDRHIQSGIRKGLYSGAVVVASAGDTVFHHRAYGTESQDGRARLQPDAVFDLASLSKPLGAGLAALFLAGKGRFGVGNQLTTLLPFLRDAKDPQIASISADMLLEHCSGYGAIAPLWEQIEQAERHRANAVRTLGTTDAIAAARQLVANLNLESKPGSAVCYSDIGFILIGWIIAELTGKPLDEYLRRELYEPLGLGNDLFFINENDSGNCRQLKKRQIVATERCAWRKRLIRGEVHDRNAWALGGVAGHAGLFGTGSGVWRLCHTLLRCFSGDPETPFHAATLRRFWTRSRRIAQTTRTFCWDTPSARGSTAGGRFSRTSVGHLGFTGTSVWVDPQNDLIGVFLANSAHPCRDGKNDDFNACRARLYDLIAKLAPQS